ncbi:Formin binding protein [Fasciolopsis buskii]|uniref:Formin binding protein n=1 Tax=Fasciolopsis buskii TaxID=27845 RepID=A0A8E0S4P0_9TREM|nr:Formin binding protein [Fasciolopsis buski]
MSGKSWGVELWDQGDGVFKQLSEQLSSTDAYIRLLLDVQKLQHDFGKRLRKSAAAYIPKKKSGPEDTTITAAFEGLAQLLSNMGAVFEAGAKNLNDQVLVGLKTFCDNDRRELDNKRAESLKLGNSVDQLRKQLDNAWQKYVTAFKEKQKAYDNWVKADKDIQLPRIEQQKMQEVYQRKIRAYDQSKAQYAAELSKFNASHRQHYNKNLMVHLEELDSMNRVRTDGVKDLLEKIHSINDGMIKQITQCNEQIKETVSMIDAEKDGSIVIDRLTTGELPPVDLPFLNLGTCPAALFDGSYQALGAYLLGLENPQSCTQITAFGSGSSAISSSASSTVSMLGGAKRGNLRTPFICDIGIRGVKVTDLTIVQVAERINDLNSQVKHTNGEIQGTQRLRQAYEDHPDMGSTKLVRPQEAVLGRRLNSLREHIKQLEDRYEALGGDRVLNEAQSKLGKMQQDLNQNEPVKSIVNPRTNNLLTDDFDSDGSFDSEPEGDPTGTNSADSPDPCSLNSFEAKSPYVGYATVKYEYEGNGSTYLAAKPGEVFYVLELDSTNSGWTSVVSEDGTRQGFVPTSFISVTQY